MFLYLADHLQRVTARSPNLPVPVPVPGGLGEPRDLPGAGHLRSAPLPPETHHSTVPLGAGQGVTCPKPATQPLGWDGPVVTAAAGEGGNWGNPSGELWKSQGRAHARED